MGSLRQKVMGTLAHLNDETFKIILQLGVKPPTFDAYKEFKLGVDTFFGGEQERSLNWDLLTGAGPRDFF